MTRRDDDQGERLRLLVAGVVLLGLVCSLIGLSIAIYNKVFDDVVEVTLLADAAGQQMQEFGDVRYRGVLVGQVRSVDHDEDQAVITLALEPELARTMPATLDAQILPTTLFGQKFVSLLASSDNTQTGVEDGTVIPQERVDTSVELSAVLGRLFPLLRAVRPADLNETLTALPTALNGRGEQLGQTLELLDGYLADLQPHLPTLRDDLRLLASVTRTYDEISPDLLAAMGDLTTTARTVVEEQDLLSRVFDEVTQVSQVGTRVLTANEVNLERFGDLSVPTLALLAKYAPQYNCLLRGLHRFHGRLNKTFEGGAVKQFVEVPAPQMRGYDRRDTPRYDDRRGPRCLGLPDNPPRHAPFSDLANGTQLDNAKGRGEPTLVPGGGGTSSSATFSMLRAAGWGSRPSSLGASVATDLLSARTGRPVAEIPVLATLLYDVLVGRRGA